MSGFLGGFACEELRARGHAVTARAKRELGWAPRYPTAAEGVPAAVAALGII